MQAPAVSGYPGGWPGCQPGQQVAEQALLLGAERSQQVRLRRNYALALNAALADKGVYAAHVPLATWVGSGGPETPADTIAGTYWELRTTRDQAERLYSTL